MDHDLSAVAGEAPVRHGTSFFASKRPTSLVPCCRCVNMAETSQKMLNAKSLREKLSSWDHKFNPNAPLSDKQKDGFMELTTLSANRPLPTEVIVEQ